MALKTAVGRLLEEGEGHFSHFSEGRENRDARFREGQPAGIGMLARPHRGGRGSGLCDGNIARAAQGACGSSL